jgi:hypothetical protein
MPDTGSDRATSHRTSSDRASDGKLVPGARRGKIGVYQRPASKKWLIALITFLMALLMAYLSYLFFT